MQRSWASAGALALAAFLCGEPGARGNFIPWQYSWNASPTTVSSPSGQMTITLTPQSGSTQSAVGQQTTIEAAGVTVSPSTQPPPPSVTEQLSVNLMDSASGASGRVTFSGTVSSDAKGSFAATFSGSTESIVLGGHLYTVTLIPGGPTAANPDGTINARVTVTNVSQAPEPSTLLLAGLGLPLAGLAGRRRRRAAAAA
jgi:hypothetical protein